MRCPKCNSQSILVEGLSNGDSKLTCQSCGYAEISNKQGKKLILDEREKGVNNRLIVEAM